MQLRGEWGHCHGGPATRMMRSCRRRTSARRTHVEAAKTCACERSRKRARKHTAADTRSGNEANTTTVGGMCKCGDDAGGKIQERFNTREKRKTKDQIVVRQQCFPRPRGRSQGNRAVCVFVGAV